MSNGSGNSKQLQKAFLKGAAVAKAKATAKAKLQKALLNGAKRST